jgi:hypothetical protein
VFDKLIAFRLLLGKKSDVFQRCSPILRDPGFSLPPILFLTSMIGSATCPKMFFITCNWLAFRPSPAVRVKIATQKVSISTLSTGYLKNTPTIIFIPLFIFLKYYFLIFFFIFYFFSPSSPPSLSLSTVTPRRWVHQKFHPQPISGQNTLRSLLRWVQ